MLQLCYTDKSMGVISLQGDAQARLIEKHLLEKLGPEEMEKRQLICGDAYAFQGDERDVIFLSLVAAPDETRRIGTLSSDKDQRRFNVAASRAKDQMWLFHTATLNDLSMNCYRYKLLEYCLNPKVEPITFEDEIINQDVLVQPFDSLFEQHVFCKIKDRGYHVVPQYNVAGYRIDLVVSGMQGQLAVECDGDRWHGPEQYEADMERQRQLERCKWTFWRIRASTFYRDPDVAMESLWDKLERLNIYPTANKEKENRIDIIEEPLIEPNQHEDENEDMSRQNQATLVPEPEYQRNVISLNDRRRIDNTEIHSDKLDHLGPHNFSAKEYVHWDQRPLPDPRQVSIQIISEGLIDIISTEGPVFVHRVFHLYLKAAGIGRLGDHLKDALLSALQKAISKGFILEANEFGDKDKLNRIVRLPNTPKVILRTRGDRALDEIPPSEIAEVMLIINKNKRIEMDDKDTLFRYVLEFYGFGRMTQKALKILNAVLKVANQKNQHFGR
ncbi:MAG: AAA domain-containing protein [Bacillota bacterium]